MPMMGRINKYVASVRIGMRAGTQPQSQYGHLTHRNFACAEDNAVWRRADGQHKTTTAGERPLARTTCEDRYPAARLMPKRLE